MSDKQISPKVFDLLKGVSNVSLSWQRQVFPKSLT